MTDATNNTTSEATEAAAEVKLSQREKLVVKYEKLALKASDIAVEITEVVNAIKAIDALASIDVGSVVVVSLGKGETSKEVTAVVVGVKDDEDGSKVYKVQYGSGFDADIAVVKPGKIKLPAVEAVVDAVEVPAAE